MATHCRLCKGPRLDYSGDEQSWLQHLECSDEWDRREANKTCVKCGKLPAIAGSLEFECEECQFTVNAPFVGYPPGAT